MGGTSARTSGGRSRLRVLAVFVTTLALIQGSGLAEPSQPWRISESAGGEQGDGISSASSVSGNSGYVAFYSDATNLVPNDRNNEPDVFVRDLDTGVIERVSVSSAGSEARGATFDPSKSKPSLSADGLLLAFNSTAWNLVQGDTNQASDIFVHDRITGVTELVSVNSNGVQGNAGSFFPSISADGRFISFHSGASNLVPDDTNLVTDVLVHDRITGLTTRVSGASTGEVGDAPSLLASISSDGSLIAFESLATNLVLDDTNGLSDVFVHDRITGRTRRISIDSAGEQFLAHSFYASISGDGRAVAFYVSAVVDALAGDFARGVFVHDLTTGETSRISRSMVTGGPENAESAYPTISGDGRYVTFQSYASDLVEGDANQVADVFMVDRSTGETERLSVGVSGEPDGGSSFPFIGAAGGIIAFRSDASNLVPGDSNQQTDVFTVRFSEVPANTPPVLDPVPPQTGPPLQEVTFTPDASDADGDPWLTFRMSDLPSGATFDPRTRRFSWRPSPGQEGVHHMRLTVFDPSGLTDQTEVVVTINCLIPESFAPPDVCRSADNLAYRRSV